MRTLLFPKVLFLVMSLIFIDSVKAISQSRTNPLEIVLNSDFIESFDALRKQAEEMVSEVKMVEQYSAEEMEDLMVSYNLTAQYFNEVLYNVKDILLSRDRRKYFFGNNGKHVADFHKVVEADLIRAERYFQNEFRKKYLNLVSNDMTVDLFVRELWTILENTLPIVINLFYQIQENLNENSKQVLDKELIEKHRFKVWEEL
ncbi:MAG: hypothetical protein R2828_30000 [Saprospiraceae bacterium]